MLTITLPWPPTVNTYWRSVNGRAILSAGGRKYRAQVAASAVIPDGFKAGQRLSVQIDAFPPDRRRRDLDNILKGLLDGLTHAGLWDDDSQVDHISIRRLEPMPGNPGFVRVKVAQCLERS